jgi:hypothetical protein
MGFIASLAETFQMTEFDIVLLGMMFLLSAIFYYALPLHRMFEAAFGAMVWVGIYVLLSVVLLGNAPMGTTGGLFPTGFSVFLVSISVYLVFALALLFPVHGGLVISEPEQPTIYSVLYFFVSIFLLFTIGAIVIYMIEQSYIFTVGNLLTWIKDSPFYLSTVKPSWFYNFVMNKQNVIIPLGIVLMLYKLLFANIVTAAILSIWYNLANIGFYRKKDDSHYRVEFHEVGSGGHGGGHDDHGPSDDPHGHSGGSHSGGHH